LKNLCLSKFVKLATWLGAICCRERFIEYWVEQNMLTADTATRIFTVLKQPDKNYLTQVSFIHFTKKCYKLWDDDKTLSTVNHPRLWSCLRTYYDNLQRLHPLRLFIPAWLYWQPLACHLMELMCICAIASICCSDHSSSSVFWVLLSWSYTYTWSWPWGFCPSRFWRAFLRNFDTAQPLSVGTLDVGACAGRF
jgi:hypothetical protein